jgi:HD-GYP domain-containing protein (c-di-GMP phosphodiesterase class II)
MAAPPEPPQHPIDRYEWINERHCALLTRPHEAPNFTAQTMALCMELHKLTQSNLDIALFQTMHRDPSDDAAVHSFGVALICAALARRLGLSEDENLRLLAASLTMNIAMLELQRQLWSQITPLTNQQRDEIHAHPERGRRWLEALGVGDMDWLRGVHEHHESPDGTGYPRGITGVSPIANIIRNIDRYCAMLGARAYRAPLAANQAARRLYILSETSNDPMPAMIIDAVGIYPPGNYVRLNNGELALVTHRGEQAHTPRVVSLTNGRGDVLPEPVPRDTTRAEFSVAELLPPDGVSPLVRADPKKIFP